MDMRPVTVRLRELATRDRLEAADRIEALEAALRHCLDELEDSHGFNRLRAVISAALLTEQDK